MKKATKKKKPQTKNKQNYGSALKNTRLFLKNT